MKKRFLFSFLVLLSFFSLNSCKKDAGQGGTAVIRGKIRTLKYDNTISLLLADYYDSNLDTYIIYGTDHNTYDDDYKTSFDGSYEFKYLQIGTYKVFAYSVDTTGVAATGSIDQFLPKTARFQTVEITKKGQVVEVPDIVILKVN